MEKDKWYHTRLIAFESMRGSHLNPKGLPRSIESYLPIDKNQRNKSKVLEAQQKAWKNQMDEYERKVSSGEIEDARIKWKKRIEQFNGR